MKLESDKLGPCWWMWMPHSGSPILYSVGSNSYGVKSDLDVLGFPVGPKKDRLKRAWRLLQMVFQRRHRWKGVRDFQETALAEKKATWAKQGNS